MIGAVGCMYSEEADVGSGGDVMRIVVGEEDLIFCDMKAFAEVVELGIFITEDIGSFGTMGSVVVVGEFEARIEMIGGGRYDNAVVFTEEVAHGFIDDVAASKGRNGDLSVSSPSGFNEGLKRLFIDKDAVVKFNVFQWGVLIPPPHMDLRQRTIKIKDR